MEFVSTTKRMKADNAGVEEDKPRDMFRQDMEDGCGEA